MNHKGAEKILSVYWFAILFIVAAGIVYMVFSFYGKPYDIRELETNALADKAADCLNYGGYMNENWQNLEDENFLSECNLNFNVESDFEWENDQYYVEIKVSDFNSNQELKKIAVGNHNLRLNCAVESDNFPVCLEREMYSFDKANSQYKITILSVVRKTEKNT